MKKITFLLLSLILFSCSSDDDSAELVSFNPPEWLIGTWNNESAASLIQTYVITENNVVLIKENGEQIDYSELINNSERHLVINEKSDTIYSYTIIDNYNDGIEDYRVVFSKVSDNEVEIFINLAASIQTLLRQ